MGRRKKKLKAEREFAFICPVSHHRGQQHLRLPCPKFNDCSCWSLPLPTLGSMTWLAIGFLARPQDQAEYPAAEIEAEYGAMLMRIVVVIGKFHCFRSLSKSL